MSKKLYEKMNLYLANQEVAYIKLHNLHWYVKAVSYTHLMCCTATAAARF